MKKNEIIELIGKNLRNLINKRNISVNELARKCKISAGTVSKIMNGSMSVTVPMIMNIAEGLEVDIAEILKGIIEKPELLQQTITDEIPAEINIGILSIDNRRATCIKNSKGVIVGVSELEKGLDLADSTSLLLQLIQGSIRSALSQNTKIKKLDLKKSNLNLVMQSYEFSETKNKFINFMLRHFNKITVLSDWQLTYICNFDKKEGLSLIVDKGVSISYRHNHFIKKIGGWKFPIYDFGGENWLGAEVVHHTVEAFEGIIPMTDLAKNILAKFGGTMNAITELCFKGNKDPDVYCLFSEILIKHYLNGDKEAKDIINRGAKHIKKLVKRADEITDNHNKIAIQGSLKEIYKPFFSNERLVDFKNNDYKAEYLASITLGSLADYGINI